MHGSRGDAREGSAAALRPATTQARPTHCFPVRFRERGGLQAGACSVAATLQRRPWLLYGSGFLTSTGVSSAGAVDTPPLGVDVSLFGLTYTAPGLPVDS